MVSAFQLTSTSNQYLEASVLHLANADDVDYRIEESDNQSLIGASHMAGNWLDKPM